MRSMNWLLTVVAVLAFVGCGGSEEQTQQRQAGTPDGWYSMEFPIGTARTDRPTFWKHNVGLNETQQIKVDMERWPGTVKEYGTELAKRFKTAKVTVLKRVFRPDEICYELKRAKLGLDWVRGQEHLDGPFHAYVRVLKRGDYVYTAVASTLSVGWKRSKEQLIPTVDSFEVGRRSVDLAKYEAKEVRSQGALVAGKPVKEPAN